MCQSVVCQLVKCDGQTLCLKLCSDSVSWKSTLCEEFWKKWKGTDKITKLVILDDFLESFQGDLSFCLRCEMHFWVSPRSAVTDIFCCLWLCDKDYLLHPGCLWYVIARQISDRSRYRVLACTWFTMSNRIESANVVTKIPIWSQKRPNFACKS